MPIEQAEPAGVSCTTWTPAAGCTSTSSTNEPFDVERFRAVDIGDWNKHQLELHLHRVSFGSR
jgi:hypothetical protein